jgi:hypothetical protein
MPEAGATVWVRVLWSIPDGVQPVTVTVTIRDKAGVAVVTDAAMTLHELTGFWWYRWPTTTATAKGRYTAQMIATDADGFKGSKTVVFQVT